MTGREKAEAANLHPAGIIGASEVRADVRMDGVYFFRSSADYPFSKKLDAGDFSYCFMVRRGELRLTIDFPEPRVIDLKPGAIVGVSGLAPHRIHSIPDMGALPVDSFERIPITEEIGPGKDVELLLGVVPSENIALTNLIIGPLYLSPETSPEFSRRIWKAAELLDEEFVGAGLEYGQAIIVRRIAEIILINMTRSLLVARGEADVGELGPIKNRGVIAAIRAFLDDPLEDWSIDRLAKHAGMSRTKFAEDFRRVVGRTPMQTLARLRLTLVTRKMLVDDLSVEEAADLAGYSSAAAFIRAFSREFGATPLQWRKMQTPRVDAGQPGG
ncbi:MAG: AraC family transcriptional regulator [Parvibaculum sp.]|uniref:helix-turn-helix domain-containing protein n=1 Tax=Parvibaculum sp. TaxID=2024848 RepID=UPI0034A0AC2E